MNRWIVPLAAAALAAAAHPAPAPAAPAPDDTLRRVVTLAPIEVSTSRAGDRAPVAHATLDREAITRANWGQDTPMVLATLPGAYAYSDAGNGIGYSYLSVRGFPQRRISVLVNGVPLNDPETHEVWWIDHPDLLASASQVQLQRGAGSALYGAASLGGSVDIATAPMADDRLCTAEVAGGSFGTKRLMLEGRSGALAGGWNLYGRYSRVETDGYRDQSWSKLWSYALSAQHASATQTWKLNLYGGPENLHLAYIGIPYENANDALVALGGFERTGNPITWPGEQDHYFEPHYELQHSWAIRRDLSLSQTFFWFDGSGWYDERRADQDLAAYRLAPWLTRDTSAYAPSHYERDGNGALVLDEQGRATVIAADLVRHREVTNRHYGWVPRARLEHAHGALTLGGELRFHDGHHVGTVTSGDGLPPGTPATAAYYDFHPRTLAAGLFAREEWDLSAAWRLTGDLAWRHQRYDMRDDRFDGVAFVQSYDFALPRLALSWTASPSLSAFASASYASREPALRDLYDGEGVGNAELFAAGKPLIRPEHVTDLELGGTWRRARGTVTANLFRMDFRDELVDAGRFDTDLGYAVLANAARSVHQGLELAATATVPAGAAALALDAGATLADNHFVKYTEHWGATAADDAVYDGKPIGFFPAAMANAGAKLAWRDLSLGAAARWTGRIFVDNTGAAASSIPPHATLDLTFGAARRIGGQRVEATLRVLNATDARYATGGWMDADPRPGHEGGWTPWLVPAAPRNLLAGIRVDW